MQCQGMSILAMLSHVNLDLIKHGIYTQLLLVDLTYCSHPSMGRQNEQLSTLATIGTFPQITSPEPGILQCSLVSG